MRQKLLFICSRNQWRSPTAEALFAKSQRYEARSAGTSPKARIVVTRNLISWADTIFTMERRHAVMLREKFEPRCFVGKALINLDIPDDYTFMDPELTELVAHRLSAYLVIE